MKRLFLLFLLFAVLFKADITFAQADYPRKNYNWEENRKITFQLTEEEAKAHAVTILDNRFIDYTEIDDNYKNIALNIELYITRHLIIRVNDTEV